MTTKHPLVGKRVMFYRYFIDRRLLRFVRKSVPENSLVRVMAVADGYAMIRFPRCVPFVIRLKDIIPPEK